MNEITNTFLLARDKIHFRLPRFTYSASRPFTENKERIKKIKETGDPRYIYQKELDKTCLQHDMGYGEFKYLNRRTATGYQRGLASVVYKFFDKRTSGKTVKKEIISNKELAEELH